jgi:hypothetical protein
MNKTDLVRQHLRQHKTITSWEAIQKYRVTRLADVVWRLKNEGMIIDSIEEKNDNDNHTHALYTHVYG